MIAEVHQQRLSRFRRGYRDAVDREIAFDPFNRRRKLADWCVDNWPIDQPFIGRDGIRRHLTDRYRKEFGVIPAWIVTAVLGAILSAVISALIDHWFSDNVRIGL